MIRKQYRFTTAHTLAYFQRVPGFTHRCLNFAAATLIFAVSVAIEAIVQAQPAAVAAPANASPVSDSRTYESWRDACKKLPANRILQDRLPARQSLPLKTTAELDQQLLQFFSLCQTGQLAQAALWAGGAPAKSPFYSPELVYHANPKVPFQPFAQKLQVPPGSEVIFHGDLHGDIHSLLALIDLLNRDGYMSGFKIVRTNAYLVFLGDYVDRGRYGIEVMYTLLRLKLANPERMFLARGNHEDVTLISRYGFLEEAFAKYGRDFDALRFSKLYDFLPPVIYVGCGTNYLQCNHGGMEPGFRPDPLLDAEGPIRFQLIGKLNQRTFFTHNSKWFDSVDPESKTVALRYYEDFVPASPTTPTLLGFMWNDFSLVPGEQKLNVDVGRGFVYGDTLTKLILEQSSTAKNKIRAVFRAHQHSSLPNPMMHRLIAGHGVFRHWQGTDSVASLDVTEDKLKIERGSPRSIPEFSVWTFNVVCDSVYGIGNHFSFDTYGVLKTAESFDQWKLTIVNQQVNP